MAEDIYTTLIYEGGLPPNYVLDEMPLYEINSLIKYLYKKHKESWEQSRMCSYVTAQTQSTKRIKPTDIMKFPWENDNNKGETKVSNEDKQRLLNKAELWQKKV